MSDSPCVKRLLNVCSFVRCVCYYVHTLAAMIICASLDKVGLGVLVLTAS